MDRQKKYEPDRPTQIKREEIDSQLYPQTSIAASCISYACVSVRRKPNTLMWVVFFFFFTRDRGRCLSNCIMFVKKNEKKKKGDNLKLKIIRTCVN